MDIRTPLCALTLIATALLCTDRAHAAVWTSNELHWQHGRLDAPRFAGGATSTTDILTLQHASGWKYFDVFAFLDLIDDRTRDGFNDSDLYGEVYVGGGFGALTGHTEGFGPFRDIGWVLGYNHAHDAKVRKYLPGLRLYWDAPGFAFLNTDIAAYIDDSRGIGRGGAPREDNSFMVDFAWAYPFDIGSQSFNVTGHVEFIGSRTNQFGDRVANWTLAQPQFRWDAGKAWFDTPNRFLLGIEYQYWRNKLGDPQTDESAVQLLAVLKL